MEAPSPQSGRRTPLLAGNVQEILSPDLPPTKMPSTDSTSDDDDDFIMLRPDTGIAHVQSPTLGTHTQAGESSSAVAWTAPMPPPPNFAGHVITPAHHTLPLSAASTPAPVPTPPSHEPAPTPPFDAAALLPLTPGPEIMLRQALHSSANTFRTSAETIAQAIRVKYGTLRACRSTESREVCTAVGTAYRAICAAHGTLYGAIDAAHVTSAATASAARRAACTQYTSSLLSMATAVATAGRALMLHGGGAARGMFSGTTNSTCCFGKFVGLVFITASLVAFGGMAGVALGLMLGCASAIATVAGCLGMLIVSCVAWILGTTCLVVGAGTLVLSLPVSLVAAFGFVMLVSTLVGVGMALAAGKKVMQAFEAQR